MAEKQYRSGMPEARHEACHAIVARALGMPVEFASIENGPDGGGVVRYGKLRSPSIDLLTAALAGVIGDAIAQYGPRLAGVKWRQHPAYRGDFEMATRYAKLTCDQRQQTCEQVVNEAGNKAIAILNANWPSVEAVAVALVKRNGLVSGKEIETICSNAHDLGPLAALV